MISSTKGRCPNTIRIIGSVGSGKTTLAKKISRELNVPYYELDNVVWKRTEFGDIRRSDTERDDYLNQILNSPAWIVEGVHHKWGLESFQRADMIIFVDTHYYIRLGRIVKRFLRQRVGVEKSNYKPTFPMLKKMFIWNASFERHSKREILDILREYHNKLVVLSDNNDVQRLLNWTEQHR